MKSWKDELFNLRDTPALYELPNLSFCIHALSNEVARTKFPDFKLLPAVFFGKMKSIACCECLPSGREIVLINSVLNSPSTPREVIEAIVIHEFLHFVIKPREVDGKLKAHPPEFFVREQEISPNINLTWGWFQTMFLSDLVRDKKRERTTLKNLRKRHASREYISFEELKTMLKNWSSDEEPGESKKAAPIRLFDAPSLIAQARNPA